MPIQALHCIELKIKYCLAYFAITKPANLANIITEKSSNQFFMRFILRMFISTCSVIITSYILPGVELESFFSAFSTALLIAFLNTIVKPLLIIFTIPVTLLTFGFFLLVINATIIMMASNLLNGFYVENFWYALIFSIILSAVNTVLSSMVASDSQPKA